MGVLVSLVAAAAAQETPLWFLETTLTGSFKERSATCKGLLGDRAEEASVGPIFIPENQPADICIRFPARDTLPETWFTTESDCSDTTAAITAPTLFQGAVRLPLCHETHSCSSVCRNWTQRRFAFNLRMGVLSTERDSQQPAGDPAAFSTGRLRNNNQDYAPLYM